MFQSFNDDDSDVVRLLLSATDAAEEEVDVTAGNDRYTRRLFSFGGHKLSNIGGQILFPNRNVKRVTET